jgi:hypothetical protein
VPEVPRIEKFATSQSGERILVNYKNFSQNQLAFRAYLNKPLAYFQGSFAIYEDGAIHWLW